MERAKLRMFGKSRAELVIRIRERKINVQHSVIEAASERFLLADQVVASPLQAADCARVVLKIDRNNLGRRFASIAHSAIPFSWSVAKIACASASALCGIAESLTGMRACARSLTWNGHP